MIGIIGCGASGMVAAIYAARAGASVTILEHNGKPGRKILATGNGHCNLTNEEQGIGNFRGEDTDAIREILAGFTKEDELALFAELGVPTTCKRGYWYPRTGQAATVATALAEELARLRVRILYGTDVKAIRAENDGFVVSAVTGDGSRDYRFDKIVLACGGPAGDRLGQSDDGFRMLRELSVPISPVMPALVPLCLENRQAKTISGVRTEADLTLGCGEREYREHGEIVWTDYGISGIPVMQLSGFASEALSEKLPVTIRLDFLGEYTREQLLDELVTRTKSPYTAPKNAEGALAGFVPGKLSYALLKRAGIDETAPAAGLTIEKLSAFADQLKAMTLTVTGTRDFTYAQVAKGGVPLSEIDPKTMELRSVPGLYVTGELLAVDGNCGGYNLQWAFATGATAGRSLGR